MPFIPHTPDEVAAMLAAIGVDSIENLFDEIPAHLRAAALDGIPPAAGEMELAQIMGARAEADGRPLSFLGAGAYEHHVPAAVWELATRGEFYTAYTPYQAEASQGTLQLLYEFQSMMAGLMAMDVSNASLYDGASALAEAVLMAVRAGRNARSRRILVPRSLNPRYRLVTRNIVRHQGIELEELEIDPVSGRIDPAALPAEPGPFAALVIPQPNYFGMLEEVDALTDWAHAAGAAVIAVVNPVAMALLAPPGEWGGEGADIACGEGQPLGIPLSSGGPYYGFLTCRESLVRQMPGRLAGRTLDADGNVGYTLTLQAREQHIRRSRATSNICTNQGLMVTASTIHMALLGAEGLERVAAASHANTVELVRRLAAIDGIEPVFQGPFFHEALLRFDIPVDRVLRALEAQNVLGGHPLAAEYPELGQTLLVCATEMRTGADIETYAGHLERILGKQRAVKCPVQPRW